MRKLSNKAIVFLVLMVFLHLPISVLGAPSNTKTGTSPAKSRVSKKQATQKAVNPAQTAQTEKAAQKDVDSEKGGKTDKTRKLEVDQAQLLLSKGIQRIVQHDASLECS